MITKPRKFQSVKELEEKIERYFKERDKIKKPYTITSLAVYLDTYRDTLLHYEKHEDKKEFRHAIKNAKARIESRAEDYLFEGKNTAGCIFNMVNNWGWKNKQEYVAQKPVEVPNENKELDKLLEKTGL